MLSGREAEELRKEESSEREKNDRTRSGTTACREGKSSRRVRVLSEDQQVRPTTSRGVSKHLASTVLTRLACLASAGVEVVLSPGELKCSVPV